MTDKQASPPQKISATPFVWRDPTAIPSRPWVYGRWLLRNTITAIVAPGGVGKSSLVASICLSLASGRALLGKDVWGGPQRAWYWNLEDDGDELARQVHAAAIQHSVGPADIDGRLFLDSGPDGAALCTAIEGPGGFTLQKPVSDALIDELLARKIDVLIIDPFVSSHEVDENANSKIAAVSKEWARIARAAKCSVVLVHHTKKLEGKKVTGDASRGATSLVNAARSVLVLNRMGKDEGDFFGVPELDFGLYFAVQDDKHNRTAPEREQWYKIVSTPLGNGDDIGVVTRWTPPSLMDGITLEQRAAVREALSEGAHRKDAQSADWAGFTVGPLLSLDPSDAMERKKLTRILARWLKDGFLEEYRADDSKRVKRAFVRPAQA